MDKLRRSQIKALLQDDKFIAINIFLKELKEKYKDEQVKADTEFETTWRTAQREAKIECIDNIMNGLMEEASKAND